MSGINHSQHHEELWGNGGTAPITQPWHYCRWRQLHTLAILTLGEKPPVPTGQDSAGWPQS